MAKNTGYDLVHEAKKMKKDFSVTDFGEPNLKLSSNQHPVSVVIPKGSMRPGLYGFVIRVIRILFILALPFLAAFGYYTGTLMGWFGR